MCTNQLLELKQTNFQNVLARKSGTYVPTIASMSYSTVSWKGISAVEAMKDDAVFVDAMTAIFKDMWADVATGVGGWFTPDLPDVFDPIQHKFAGDGTTLENIQCTLMRADEYDLLIQDPMGFVKNVLLPRKYPRLFTDREWAETALKAYTQARVNNQRQTALVLDKMKEEYGIASMFDLSETVINPFDHLFDAFRGFQGTLLDLRRQPAKVKAAVEKLWEVRCLPKYNTPVKQAGIIGMQVPHIPTYLSPKQFEELYWPYERELILRLANAGCKLYIMLEGKWKRYLHLFLELPKDSCVLWVDDDDLFEVYEAVGHWQIICGGVSIASLRMDSMDNIKDKVMRIIDTCAVDGGFIYCTRKSWISPGDVNQNLVDTFNFVHEYSSR